MKKIVNLINLQAVLLNDLLCFTEREIIMRDSEIVQDFYEMKEMAENSGLLVRLAVGANIVISLDKSDLFMCGDVACARAFVSGFKIANRINENDKV